MPGGGKLNRASGNEVLTPRELSFHAKRPGSLSDDEGDLHNRQTQQMMMYVPAESRMDVFFQPLDGSTPLAPVFLSIPLD